MDQLLQEERLHTDQSGYYSLKREKGVGIGIMPTPLRRKASAIRWLWRSWSGDEMECLSNSNESSQGRISLAFEVIVTQRSRLREDLGTL